VSGSNTATSALLEPELPPELAVEVVLELPEAAALCVLELLLVDPHAATASMTNPSPSPARTLYLRTISSSSCSAWPTWLLRRALSDPPHLVKL
jgi:hypothetical protein